MNEATLCVGIDVHQNTLNFYPLDKATSKSVKSPLTVLNNRPGAEQAISNLCQILFDHGYDHLELAMEATGNFWLPLYDYLQKHSFLAPFHPLIVSFNPKLVAKFKGGLDLRKEKNDNRDAYAIAERLRFGHLPKTFVPESSWQALRRLTRYRCSLSHALAWEKTRFLAYSFLKLSSWQQVEPFSDSIGATSAALLTEFSFGELAEMPLEEMVDLIVHYGRGHFKDPIATAQKVKETLKTSYPVAPELDEAVTFTLSMMLEHIRFLEKLLKELELSIAKRMEHVSLSLIHI